MKKYTLIPVIALAFLTSAGKYKISKVGQPDTYVPTLESDAKTIAIEALQGPGFVPLGGIVPVAPAIDATNAWQPPSSGVIKDGFMRADGTTISISHRNAGCKLATGTVLPNMVNRYPRGNTTSGSTGTGSNTVTLGTANIPQMSGDFGSGTVSADHVHAYSVSIGTAGSHSHLILIRYSGGGVGWIGGDYSPGGPHKIVRSNDLPYYANINVSNQSGTEDGANHSHTISGSTAGISVNHTHGTAVALGSASPTEVNNEPAYTEVVWVIRVK